MFGLGVPELIVILVLALLVFGPRKLPELGSFLGKSLRDFRDSLDGRPDDAQGPPARRDAEDSPDSADDPAQPSPERSSRGGDGSVRG